MITIRDIRKSFDDRPVLRGVNIDVRDRETLVVLGRSGGGKSVMLKMIIGLLRPDSGSINVDGSDVLSMSYPRLRELRFKFGYLFQGAALFDSLTVGENVALALRRGRARDELELNESEIAERVSYALDVVGLKNTERAMPANLSGGMKKRVGLARAIVPRPRYVLYDEPTTGLDPIVADSIDHLILRVRDRLDVTSVVVTHDMRSARRLGQRILLLHNKRIHASGTPDEIFNSQDPIVRQFVEGVADPKEVDF